MREVDVIGVLARWSSCISIVLLSASLRRSARTLILGVIKQVQGDSSPIWLWCAGMPSLLYKVVPIYLDHSDRGWKRIHIHQRGGTPWRLQSQGARVQPGLKLVAELDTVFGVVIVDVMERTIFFVFQLLLGWDLVIQVHILRLDQVIKDKMSVFSVIRV